MHTQARNNSRIVYVSGGIALLYRRVMARRRECFKSKRACGDSLPSSRLLVQVEWQHRVLEISRAVTTLRPVEVMARELLTAALDTIIAVLRAAVKRQFPAAPRTGQTIAASLRSVSGAFELAAQMTKLEQ